LSQPPGLSEDEELIEDDAGEDDDPEDPASQGRDEQVDGLTRDSTFSLKRSTEKKGKKN